MKMITPNYENVIRVRKYNRLIFRNDMDRFKFIDFLDKSISCKNEKYKILFDNCDVSNDYIYINLVDNSSIYKQLKYVKGTLFYDYLNYNLNCDDIENGKLFQNIFDFFDIIKEKSNFSFVDFEYNESIGKLFSSLVNVRFVDDLDYVDVFNKLLEEFAKLHIDKKILLVYNSDILNIVVDYENLFVIDMASSFDVFKSNILVVNSYVNELNFNYIFEYICDNYPINHDDKVILKKLEEYFIYYFSHVKLNVNDFDVLIIGKLLSKIYVYNHDFCIENINMNDNIKSFLTNF